MNEMTYKISVVKASDGSYLVNHYPKAGDTKVPDFAGVVNQLVEYAQDTKALNIFEEEPVLQGLRPEEDKAIKGIRSLVLEERILLGRKKGYKVIGQRVVWDGFVSTRCVLTPDLKSEY